MAFDLTTQKETVIVSIGGYEIEFYCRRPTPVEVLQYQRDIQNTFKKGKMVPDAAKIMKVQADYGEKVLEGVKEGDLTANGQVLTEKTPDWIKIIRKQEPRILSAIGRAMFEGAEAEKREEREEDPLAV